jgi:hypothetical protein
MTWTGSWLGNWLGSWLGQIGGEPLDTPGCLEISQALYGDVALAYSLASDVELSQEQIGDVSISITTCDQECCMNYDIGDMIRLSGSFTNSAGTATDPTTVTLKVKDPSGNIDTYTYALSEVTKDSTGAYHKDITIDEAGQWYYRFVGTGTVAAAEEGEFEVRDSQFD